MADGQSSNSLTDQEYEAVLLDDELYFEACLQIRTKDQGLQPLKLNNVQKIVHAKCEEQITRTGRVRLIIPKARQMGISTYVGARFYKKTSTNKGVRTQIITHEDDATQNLFGMAKRYHENCLPDFRPQTSASNANELAFGRLDSGYKIATAGARSAGRSSTIQCLHASEFDFWPDATADEVWTGITEAIPNADDTEVIIESTAKVPGGRFHRIIKAALAGDSSYEVLFLPWFWHEEYVATPPEGWEPPPAFKEYGTLHGLSVERLYWAWLKNRDAAMTHGASPDEFTPDFKTEYPATVEEAFEVAGDDFIRVFPRAWVKAAQARWIANREKERRPMSALGIDPAQGGGDKSAFAPWHGPRLEQIKAVPGVATPDGPAVAAIALTLCRDGATLGIDVTGGHGGDAYTHCHKHLQMPTVAVNFSHATTRKTKDGRELYGMRDELHWDLREGLNPESGENLELPPDTELEEEMLVLTFEPKPGGIKIIAKDVVRVILKRSPDKLDAAIVGYRAMKMIPKLEDMPERVRRKMEAQRKRRHDVFDSI
jgi:hypothetical protein